MEWPVSCCYRRVGKRHEGPLLDEKVLLKRSEEDAAEHSTESDGSQRSNPPRGRRRRPTVSAEVAAEELDRLESEEEEDDTLLTGDIDRKSDNTQGLREQRINELRSQLPVNVKLKSGLFDRSVTLDISEDGRELEWYAVGARSPEGTMNAAEILSMHPSSKNANGLELVGPQNTVVFIFQNMKEMKEFENTIHEVQGFIRSQV